MYYQVQGCHKPEMSTFPDKFHFSLTNKTRKYLFIKQLPTTPTAVLSSYLFGYFRPGRLKHHTENGYKSFFATPVAKGIVPCHGKAPNICNMLVRGPPISYKIAFATTRFL